MIWAHSGIEVAQENKLFLAGDIPDDGCEVLVELVLCIWGGGDCWWIRIDEGDRAISGIEAESQKSADLTENGYPRTLTSSHPSDNVIKTSAEVTRQAVEITCGWSRLGNDGGREGENPSTDKHLKILGVFETSQSPGDPIYNSQLEHLK